MRTIQKTGQFLLSAVTAIALAGACNKDDREQARIAQAKQEAKDIKDRAEKKAERIKEAAERRAKATEEAADRKVDEIKSEADHAKDDLRHEVRGTDEPDRARWRDRWERFTMSPASKWNGDDGWVVERTGDGELRAHRRDADRYAGAKMDDDAVTTAVKGRFATAPDVGGSHIDVDTHDGNVTLKGTVPSNDVAGEAVRVALGTKGVRTVISRLTVR